MRGTDNFVQFSAFTAQFRRDRKTTSNQRRGESDERILENSVKTVAKGNSQTGRDGVPLSLKLGWQRASLRSLILP